MDSRKIFKPLHLDVFFLTYDKVTCKHLVDKNEYIK